MIPEYAHHYHIQRIYKVEIPVKKLSEFGAPKRQHLTDLTDNSQFLDPNKNNGNIEVQCVTIGKMGGAAAILRGDIVVILVPTLNHTTMLSPFTIPSSQQQEAEVMIRQK